MKERYAIDCVCRNSFDVMNWKQTILAVVMDAGRRLAGKLCGKNFPRDLSA